MILAQEARKIANESDAAVSKYLEKLDKTIRELAENGRTEYACVDNLTRVTVCTSDGKRDPGPNTFQQRLVTALKNHGYGARWGLSGHPSKGSTWGLMDDDDIRKAEAATYQNYGVVLSW